MKGVTVTMDEMFDVLIIGSGVVGSAVARELSRYSLKIGVLEKEPDVCCGTSARNSGVLHAGFNNKPGSLMARFCVEGNRGFDEVARELDIPYKRTGKLVVGFTPTDRERLLAMKETGDKNGVPGLEIVDRNRINKLAPAVRGEFALWSPSTAILDPFQYTLGLAENAALNGVRFFFNNEVTGLEFSDGIYHAKTTKATYRSRWVVNCAGLGSAKISAMLGMGEYTIHPCRGEYFVLDPKIGPLLPLPAYPIPNPAEGGLGIHVTPTVDGNVLIGPSSEYIDGDDDYSCTQQAMDLLIKGGSKILPAIKREHFIRNFAGIRPKLTSESEGGFRDFVIERRPEAPHAVNLVGIESPGLTAALPIAGEVIRLMQQVETFSPNHGFNPVRKGITPFRNKTPEQQAELIKENPDYGEIVCRCETITKAEVLAAIRNPLGVDTVTGIKYRCRTMMGRCQGGYCQTRVAELIMQESHKTPEEVLYSREGSYQFTGTVR